MKSLKIILMILVTAFAVLTQDNRPPKFKKNKQRTGKEIYKEVEEKYKNGAKQSESPDSEEPAVVETTAIKTAPAKFDKLSDVIDSANFYFREGKSIIKTDRNAGFEKLHKALIVALEANVSNEDKPKLSEFIDKLSKDIDNLRFPYEPLVSPTPKPEPVETPDQSDQIPVEVEKYVVTGSMNTCDAADSPLVQGLRLDTPLAEIKSGSWLNFKTAKPSTTIPDTFIFIKPNKNVNFLALTFYKNRLMFIGVDYAPTISWDSLFEFRNKIAESLNISGLWKNESDYYSSSITKSSITCKNFTLLLQKDIRTYSLLLTSNVILNRKIQDAIDAREKQKLLNEKKKATFKP